MCVPGVGSLRHPRPEKGHGSMVKTGSLFLRSSRFLTLEDTTLYCRKSAGTDVVKSYNLLLYKCVRGKRPGQLMLVDKKGRKICCFYVEQDGLADEWFSKLQYACSWGLEEHYTLKTEEGSIGRGGYGHVYRASCKSGEEFAVKIIEMNKLSAFDKSFVCKEIQLLPTLTHKNIIATSDIFVDRAKETVSVAMELMKGGDLLDYIRHEGPLKEDVAKSITKQLLNALVYLHNRNIAHRDLKPENVLLRRRDSAPEIVLTDFGFADEIVGEGLVVNQHNLRFSGGTIGYIAPEIVLGDSHTTAVDMWACGVILYILLSAHKPFSGTDDASVRATSMTGDYHFRRDSFRNVSEDAKSLISSLLKVQPTARLTAQSALLHRWMDPDSYKIRSPSTTALSRWRKATLAVVFLGTWRSNTEGQGGQFKMQLLSLSKRRRLSKSFAFASQLDIVCRNTTEAD